MLKIMVTGLLFLTIGCSTLSRREYAEQQKELAIRAYEAYILCSDEKIAGLVDNGEAADSAILHAHKLCYNHFADHELATYQLYFTASRSKMTATVQTRLDMDDALNSYRASRNRLIQLRKKDPKPASI